jgi:hypothetical protein
MTFARASIVEVTVGDFFSNRRSADSASSVASLIHRAMAILTRLFTF